MSEVELRSEHSRSLADADRYRALETLTELGVLIPVAELEVFHGRVTKSTEPDWEVDPSFKNASNDNDNLNVNNRPTLYTAGANDAREHAVARLRREPYRRTARPENGAIVVESNDVRLYRIVSDDPDALVINPHFLETALSTPDRERYLAALNHMVLPLTAGSPVGFADRHKVASFATVMERLQSSFVTESTVADIAEQAGIDQRLCRQLVGAYNAAQLARARPSLLASRFLDHSGDLPTLSILVGGDQLQLPLNMEYVARYMQVNHIVGVQQTIESITLGRTYDVVSFFDLTKVGTAEQIAERKQALCRRLGVLAAEFAWLDDANMPSRVPLLRHLQNPYAKPEQLLAAAKEVGNYGELFDASAGNQEGYTLGEHTETVLRNFDENHADKVPTSWLLPLRLALLTHDLGKPIAARNNERYQQKAYNAHYAAGFLRELGVEGRLANLVLAVIGDGAELMHEVQVRHAGEPAVRSLRALALRTMQQFVGSDNAVRSEHIDGFIEMCRILQTCDGGAYTSMAVTRSPRGWYRNFPSFNGTFAAPYDPGKRSIRLREAGQPAAPADLTPKP